VYVGGAKGNAGTLYAQQSNGDFVSTNEEVFAQDAISEDVGAAFFDATGNGHLDLYVVSGGYEFSDTAPALQDRLYVNDGTGSFERARDRLPRVRQSGAAVETIDFDGDGDRDLFVGGRVVPWAYGRTPQSYVFENDGSGHFSDVTDEVAPALGEVGMVTDAAWTDLTGDGREELVVVGDWMPITVFENTGARLERMETTGLENSRGWWTRLLAEDVTGNGRTDLVVGNFGTNMRLQATPDAPVSMYVGDFNRNGRSSTLLTHYVEDREVPVSLRGPLVRQFGFVRRRFPTHEAYADATIDDVYRQKQLLLATASVHTTSAACDYLADRVTAEDTVLVVSVTEPGMDPRDSGDATNVARTRLVDPTVEVLTPEGEPGDVIRDLVADRGVDEVLVGTHRGDPDAPAGLGGTAADLPVSLDVPVVVVPLPDLD
jgi:nucleotide-binding universal stress UspA family protein